MALVAGCAAIAIVGFSQSLQFYNGEKNSYKIVQNYYDRDWQKVLLLTRKADQQPYTLNNYSVPILFYRGIALSMNDNDKSAITVFNKALELAPYHVLTHLALGTSYIKTEQYDAAITACEQALKMSSKNRPALYNIAVSHYNKKEFKQAFEYISQIPVDAKDQPEQFKSTYTTIAKLAVFENRARFNAEKLNAWLNDDKRILETIRKTQADNCSIEETLLKELGSR